MDQPISIPAHFIPYFAWLIMVTIIGTIGNILIILAVAINKKLQIKSNIFVVNLALADICVTAVIIPCTAVGLINNAQFFDVYPKVCIGLGALVVVSCTCSIWSIVAISLERYFHICHLRLYLILYNKKTTPFMVISLWIIAFLIALPYFDYFGWGEYTYIVVGHICTWTWTTSYFYSLYLIGLGLVVPMIIIPYCYIRIYLYVRKSKQRLLKSGGSTTNYSTKWKAPDTKILKTIGTIWITFMLMWAPYTANVLLDFYKTWPTSYMDTGVALCLSSSSINFIIYGIMNKHFRRSYFMIYDKIIICSGQRDEISVDSYNRRSTQRQVTNTNI